MHGATPTGRGHLPNAVKASVIQLLLEFLDLVLEAGVAAEFALDFADRVQHRGVIASAEAAADLRQAALRELLGQIHADLARPHHRAVTALREDVAFRDAVVARDDAQDVLDLDPAGLDALDQVTDGGVDHVDSDRRAHVLPDRVQPRDDTLQLAAALGQPLGQQSERVTRYVE